MSNQLLQAAINAKDILQAVAMTFDKQNLDMLEGMVMAQVYEMIEQLVISIEERQEQMQAADAYETQFAPIESLDSAEGSPICPECGAVMIAEYDGNEQIIGYDCTACLAEYSNPWDVEGAIDDE